MSDQAKLTPAQERTAVLRIDENLALRSGAGCGKTTVLARRFTELLMRRGKDVNPLSRLVALTFTEKAALEMSQRVRRFLAETAKRSRGESQRMLRSWLEELPEARINTIHGFCASVLRGRAIDAGVDPDFVVCGDEALADQMLARAAEEAVLAAVEEGRQDAAELVAETSLDEAAELAAEMVRLRASCNLSAYTEARAITDRWTELLAAGRQEAWRRLSEDEIIRRQLGELEAIPCREETDKLAEYRRRQVAIIRTLLSDPGSRKPETFAQLNKSPGNIGSPASWGGQDAIKAVRARMKELNCLALDYADYAEELGPLDSQAAEALAALARLALDANARYAAAKRRRGMLDFTDLLERTDALLRDRPAVCRALGGEIDQLLIDECQDTDAFQVALLERLIFGRPWPPGRDSLRLGDLPSPQAPTDGRLFVVGDAKQSIYRFRGAQVEVFEDLCRRLGPERQEKLDLSFRTHQAGAAFVNHLFAQLMGKDYEPIQAARRQCPPQAAVQVLLASAGNEQPIASAGEAVRLQAAATAQRIKEMIDGQERIVWDDAAKGYRPVQPRDVAILFGRMGVSLHFERELGNRNIPWYVVAGTGFFEQQEVWDVLNALRAIDNPSDDVALFGVLRSGLFGLDDGALLRISLACRPPYWAGLPTAAASMLPRTARRQLEFACQLLGKLHDRKDAIGIDALLDRLLIETGYEATLLAQPQGRRALGNVRMLLDRARAAAAVGVVLADFIAQVEELVLSESRYEQAVVIGEADNVVRLMTIHKAKGLEFPVVFVPDLNRSVGGSRSRLLLRSDWGLVYRPREEDAGDEESEPSEDVQKTADKPVSWRLASSLEKREQQKEDVRKLYVAATRAKDCLVLVAADWRTKDGRFQKGNCYINQIDSALGISQALDEGRDGIPYDGGRHVASLRVAGPSAPRGRRRRQPGLELLSDAHSGDELAEAISRLARPVALPPLLGPLPPSAGRAELAVTALSEFAICPMLYRWQYELRLPASAASQGGQSAGPLDAATLGTVFHRCMELLDFSAPQPAELLVRQAMSEIHLEGLGDPVGIAAELEEMIRRFKGHYLCAAIASGKKVFRELDFALAVGRGVLHGKIDLLLQDSSGCWTIVDYKSDRIGAEGLASHAERYGLQVLAYAAAAAAHLGQPPREAVLYFLRSGDTHALKITTASLDSTRQRLVGLISELLESQRTGRFPPHDSARCPSCPYGALCRRA